jgi:hypothetical protein
VLAGLEAAFSQTVDSAFIAKVREKIEKIEGENKSRK